jgi:paraquat-inducible protein B
MQPKSPLRLANTGRAETELPTVRGVGLEQIMAIVGGIVDKLDKVDYVAMGAELQGTLKGANALVNGPKLQSSLTDLAASLASLRGILRTVDSRAEPITANLEQALAAAREALEKSKGTLAMVEGILATESPLHHHAVRLAQELAVTARSLRSLVEMLERDPQSLLLGKKKPEGDK